MRLKKRLAIIGLAGMFVLASCATARSADTFTGAWSLESGRNYANFSMDWSDANGDHSGDESRDIDVHSLGIDPALASSGSHVTFSQRRETGACVFEGWVANGKGGGTFSFTPDAAFFDAMSRRGLAPDSPSQEISAMMLDITRSYIDGLSQAGVSFETFHDILRMRAMSIDSGYVRDLASVGFSHLDVHDYVRLKALNVDSAYVKYLQGHGLSNLTVREVIRLKAQQI